MLVDKPEISVALEQKSAIHYLRIFATGLN